jgi:hypothetical protein
MSPGMPQDKLTPSVATPTVATPTKDFMYNRWASGCPTTRHYRTDTERRDTYRRNADINSKSSQEEHRDAMPHETHKHTERQDAKN